MLEKFLPIGTVVLLKEGTQKVMITGYLIYSKDSNKKEMYDYGACIFPEGVISADSTLVFNHDQIDKIVYLGYENEEQANFNTFIKENEELVRKKFEEASNS